MNQSSPEVEPTSLIKKFATRYSIDANKLLSTLKATAFKQKKNAPEITNEQMMALLIVADQYGLNPFTKEIYAFPDKSGGIIPVVGVDGWSRIINTNSQFDGLEFNQSDNFIAYPNGGSKSCPEWIECVLYRKDRTHPIKVREYLDEVYRPPFNGGTYMMEGPWQTHTKRMLRHKAMIQGARVGFGFVGIYDQDEAERILESKGEFNDKVLPKKETVINPVLEHKVDNDFTEEIANMNFGDFSDFDVNEIDSQKWEAMPVQSTPQNVVKQGQTVSPQDEKFITQLVNFARKNKSWETTQDSFNERYSGETLDYATNALNRAYQQVYQTV